MITKKIMLDEEAYLEAYIADKTAKYTRKAILVIPGGGYGMVCADREGEPIALAFLPYGFNAFVLHYSVGKGKTFPTQLIQASKAIKHIRENAEEYGIDENEIFAVGFSAGGHLAASLGVMWDDKSIYDGIDMPYGCNKPKGVMLIYPVVSGISEYAHRGSFEHLLGSTEISTEQLKRVSIECNVTEKSVPAYIIHAANDSVVPVENSLLLAQAYSKNNVPFELHIFPKGEHGFALGNEITWNGKNEYIQKENAKWIDSAVAWAENL